MVISAKKAVHLFGVMMCTLSLASSLLIAACSSKEKKVPYYDTADFTPIWNPSDEEIQNMHRVHSFHFTNQYGETVRSEDLKGKVYLANFFYTSCKGICPKMTNNIQKVYAKYKGAENVKFLSFSVTPNIDSASKLHSFAEANNIKDNQWQFLTGNITAIYDLARKSYFIEEADGFSKDSTEFLHTENMVLVDGSGHLRGLYNGTIALEADKIITDIQLLLDEH